MHIKLIKKKIHINDYRLNCAIGKRGITKYKKEGDLSTPRGTFKLKTLFYRKDRVKNLNTGLKKIAIKKNMGWCNDPKSKSYNKLIKLPFKYNCEKLYKKNNTYDIFIVLNYNYNPVVKKRGSAIFLHIAKKNYKPTLGCVALSKKNFKLLLNYVKRNTVIKIY
jgi:L,D-peptidoglycan transpeptidase YkuD (ErfK/YbiS/YcfS/YnhG family)|tara:strand:- start:1152 stop:1643 length:492 start_codon:yes stop_codon:yes gene_type:complete